jgi:outer membrane protein OmpA-like peptidoglycan-associated protein/Tol biopolymer transport system component
MIARGPSFKFVCRIFFAAVWLLLAVVTVATAQETSHTERVRTQTLKKANLGKEINSEYSELSPIISPDGKLLFFTMGVGNPANLGADHLQDGYVSRRTQSGGWSQPINLGLPINSAGNDAISGVSADGSVLFIKNFDYNRVNGLCFAKRTAAGWKIDSITIDNYSNSNTLASQCISPDAKFIVYSAESIEGYGGLDLYVTRQIDASTNHYGTPENLGPVINTAKDDFAPFLASDGQSLYFSSRGHGGYGDADVFVSKRLDDSWVNWTAPKNLGPEINTQGMDAYYSIPASGDIAYYSSSNGTNHMDLYIVSLSDDIRPNPVILVTGKVVNQKGAPLEAAITYTRLLTDTSAAATYSSSLTGHFAVVLPFGYEYALRVESPGYLPYSDNLDLREATMYRELSSVIVLDSIAIGSTITLRNIFFDLDKSTLRPESHFELDRLVELLKHHPKWAVQIEGHTDTLGMEEHNRVLSKSRAEAVAQYLTSKDIDAKRMTSIGLGSSQPVAPNDTEDGRQRNRRVVFRVLRTE